MGGSCRVSNDVAANGISFCLDGIVADVDSLHVERNIIVGMNYLGIIDE